MAHEVRDCRWPWNRLYMHANGDIKPCCYATMPLGNVLDGDTPAKVWDGEEMRELRRNIAENRIHKVCAGAGCSFIRSRMPEDADAMSQSAYSGVPEDIVPAHTEALAKLGQRDALMTLGYRLLEKAGPRPQRLTAGYLKTIGNAYLWLYRAHRKRSVLATYHLALSLHLWNTAILNRPALTLARQAASDGCASAYILAGRILLEGRGMGEKRDEATEMFRKGAELGDPMGYYLMGRLAMTDDSQLAEARCYLTLAKRRGVREAQPALEQLEGA